MAKYDATMKERLNSETEKIKELWVKINHESRARKMAQWLRLLVSLADNLNLVSTTHTVASKPPVTVATEFW